MGPGQALVDTVNSAVYVIPTDSRESDGTLSWDSTTLIVVTARAAGAEGLGWTYGSPAVASVVADQLAGIVTGTDVMDLPGTFDRMNRAIRNIGREGIASMAISAVEIALWDIKARAPRGPGCRADRAGAPRRTGLWQRRLHYL
jgi:L-alanine-DL-glutamate epimerase-like enolase superfamily enzyme